MKHINTYSGQRINPFTIMADDIHIDDIARGLSQVARWSGHSGRGHYSVAQHSGIVSVLTLYETNGRYGLEALLHDAPEALGMGDVAGPLKDSFRIKHPVTWALATYRAMEERLMEQICIRFGLLYPLPPIIKEVDVRVGVTEARSLMSPEAGRDIERRACAKPYPFQIVPARSSQDAYSMFMAEFEKQSPAYRL